MSQSKSPHKNSIVVESCQLCGSRELKPSLFLGYLPPVNQMHPIGKSPDEQAAYPAQLLYCSQCQLAQLGLIVHPTILFPPEYPYSSGTTRILRENFAELYRECNTLQKLTPQDLVIDIGSNDGTLLENFKTGGHRVLGIEPTQMGELANSRGIQTLIKFFDQDVATSVRASHGPATLITATNVFAHIDRVHDVVENILKMLGEDGIFISESHYLISLIETLQYDTIYHEHLRYYSLSSLTYLLKEHGLEVFHAKKIPTHGGSIRVYAARKGRRKVQDSVPEIVSYEKRVGADQKRLEQFARQVMISKLELHALLLQIKQKQGRIYGVGAPSRASTVVNYVGLDNQILDCVLEIKGSHKVGKYMPGTLIPVLEESKLFTDQPEYALLLSWHIADELMPELVSKRVQKGKFIIPLPTPKVVEL